MTSLAQPVAFLQNQTTAIPTISLVKNQKNRIFTNKNLSFRKVHRQLLWAGEDKRMLILNSSGNDRLKKKG
jgi:hypothetical protein